MWSLYLKEGMKYEPTTIEEINMLTKEEKNDSTEEEYKFYEAGR